MVIRKIITIDEDKCNGCGACVTACHEGAIGMVNGKARLLRDDYCDGLGDCLPACPTGAISFTEREASAYDAAAVNSQQAAEKILTKSCPGSRVQSFAPVGSTLVQAYQEQPASELRQWPVQIKLAPTKAPYFAAADLLIAADCTAYAYADFHHRFIRGHITLIGCPKLDMIDYSEKLSEIIRDNDISSITVVRMQVPCCGGLEKAVRKALQQSGKNLSLQVIIVTPKGAILQPAATK